ncbi:flagellar assembly factor fliw [Bacillus sp. OxB-1]|uniref:flagellar assembly protein FliW n=1 Tax=Bacillus sp. (strain OxB-1) TaxID=98228 RepID=UPI0005822211|nr:flagellar assembly protein FliW [Bacillus sp. OxB-1]BAQ10175.1 flagellar assembly factor fliw [Bacillus sp. OxB-1]
MQIETKFHGSLEIKDTDKWSFPKGLPGFEEEKEFTLLPIEGNDIFQVLQSTKTPAVAFIVANPYTLIDDYSFDIDEPTIELLGIQNPEDIMVLGVVSLKQPFENSTINLQAPLIFQLNNRKAKQMILNDNRFDIRQPIGKGGN